VLVVVLDRDFQTSESELNTHMAPAFLRISRKLLSASLAEHHGVYCHRTWELRLCNLLTREFAYLSILYGSRREMPTGLIDCVVQFCW
jgi:hypothetical protein